MLKLNWINQMESADRTVALGTFDGVHLGHQQLLKTAVEHSNKMGSTSCAFTFERPPEQYFSGIPRLITSFERKVQLIQETGIQEIAWVPFNKKISSLSPEEFIQCILVGNLHAREIICGFNFRFGKDRRGDVDFLRSVAKKHDFSVTVVEPVKGQTVETISSTSIRSLIEEGNLSKATRYLGYYVSYLGTVKHGAGRGRILGFPTANLEINSDLVLPGEGVYLTWCILHDGSGVPSVTSVGKNPTFSGKIQTVESFILDFSSDLYYQKLEIQFLQKLRDIVRYDSPEALQRQIKFDVATARDLLTRYHLQDGRIVLK